MVKVAVLTAAVLATHSSQRPCAPTAARLAPEQSYGHVSSEMKLRSISEVPQHCCFPVSAHPGGAPVGALVLLRWLLRRRGATDAAPLPTGVLQPWLPIYPTRPPSGTSTRVVPAAAHMTHRLSRGTMPRGSWGNPQYASYRITGFRHALSLNTLSNQAYRVARLE